MKPLLLLVPLALLSSCSFNRGFYAPDRLDRRMNEVTIKNPATGDTVVLHFDGADKTARFTDTHNRPKDMGFDLQTVPINSASGNRLYSWFIRPAAPARPDITILFLHGNDGNVLSHLGLTLPLVKQGFQVMLVDYSGYGFSEGRPTRKKMVQDAESALEALLRRPETKGTKVVIYGQSMGGQVASRTAELQQARVNALVAEGVPSSHREIAGTMFPLLRLPAKALVRERYSAASSVGRFHKPVLVVHSTEDKVIPYRMGRKIYAKANEPKLFYEIKHDHLYGPVYYADTIAAGIRQLVN